MTGSSLQSSRQQITEAVTARLVRRPSSAFARVGADAVHDFVTRALDALERDLESGKHQAVRAFVYGLIDELTTDGVTFSDLRALCQNLRKHVREVVRAGELEEVHARVCIDVEAWFYELFAVCTMRFMAWRDEAFQQTVARARVEQLESQLGELEVALAEKTELLEVIHEASTPIVPVVEGILVVPLVGTLDGDRAERLTEKLLGEVSRVHARTAIIDISGVPVFDTVAAQLMIRLANSVRLLGARVFVVGMSPQTAQTIVELDIDLTRLRTFGTLQAGLAAALRAQALRICPQ